MWQIQTEHISDLERGTGIRSIEVVQRISKALNETMGVLLN